MFREFLEKTEKALKVQELIGKANDLIYFSKGDDLINQPIPPRQLELAGRKISEICNISQVTISDFFKRLIGPKREL